MDTPSRLPYHHTQIGYATLIGLTAGAVTQVGSFVRDLRARRRRAWLSGALLVLSAAMLYAFSRLTTDVRDDAVEVAFASGLARRRFPVRDITATEVITVPWLSGWGIRATANGWLYNVSGRKAVLLSLADDRHFSIGTDEPEALIAAIEAARGEDAEEGAAA